MLSLASTRSPHRPDIFHHQSNNKIPFRCAKITHDKIDSPCWSSRFAGCWNFPSSRRRFYARSPRTEGDSRERIQVSDERTISSTSAKSPANSFLSLLCPLLKLFGVRSSFVVVISLACVGLKSNYDLISYHLPVLQYGIDLALGCSLLSVHV